jgi:hypothetical protein
VKYCIRVQGQESGVSFGSVNQRVTWTISHNEILASVRGER